MKSAIQEIIISIIYWTLAIMFSVTIRFVGIEFFIESSLTVSLKEVYIGSIPGGMLGGLFWGILEVVDNRYKIVKTRSFSRAVITKTIIYSIIFFCISFLASWMGYGTIELTLIFLTSGVSVGNFIFFIIASLLFHFFKIMNKKYGPGILFQYLTGKYYNPKEENRIFMFLDLKSSTSIAEKLSHVLYSKLIQDCFLELTEPVLSFKGHIYQYVGDEVVISWKKEAGLYKANCLNFYYDFINRLENKKNYFLKTYNVFPEFKAGLSLGLVTVAEVGELKTEIAYHGDVLNTASRIQGFCNKFNKPLLVSETFYREINDSGEFHLEPIGEVQIRGKTGLSEIYSCEKYVVNS